MEYWEYWTPEEHERLIENMSAWMDGELPDIANTPEAGGPDDLELEVAEHQACCPSCRALFGELKELRAGFEALPEPDPPEGFAQGVMDRIRAEEAKKVIPLFKRPQVRALAGLAACLVLAVGLYGASQQKKQADWDTTVRSFNKDAQVAEGECPQVNADLVDPQLEDAPQIASYAAPEGAWADSSGGTAGMEKAAPEDGLGLKPVETGPNYSMEQGAELVLTLEQLPEGAEDLILSSEAASAVEIGRDGKVCYHCVTLEELARVEEMAQDQGISASLSSGTEASGRYVIIVLNTGE